MKMKKIHARNLFIAQSLRVVVVILILLVLDVPTYAKIILVILTDTLDCSGARLLFPDWIDCNTDTYQRSDKITDLICYVILFMYLVNYAGLPCHTNCALMVLLVYRIVGTGLFLVKHDRSYLFYFPNFFLEISLWLTLINHVSALHPYSTLIISSIIVYKILLEYYLHVYKVKHKKHATKTGGM